ncbi:hypothetical protein I5730_14770 [Acinetobacter nosocomialis]|uniref:hypothetical protein n=1 Tax=Acinetobacter TaxID=469 RepID=UPI0019015B89|nr:MULTISPECIES: hypothetical protein [Acinetobacter]MBJ9961804.1 hypothetical protein [Acinetobacter nosocomialis]MCO8114653.1 hypothetical protein [Acinetobacter lwoffii]
MQSKTVPTNFIEMINTIELPSDIKSEVLKHHDRFEFVFNNCLQSPELLKTFYAKYNQFKAGSGEAHNPIKAIDGMNVVAMSIEEVAAFIIYLYQMVYLPLRPSMMEVEKEAQFNNAAHGRA